MSVFTDMDDGEVGVCGYGLTFLLRARELGSSYVAIPEFRNRGFRHSCIFVNADRGITGPQDLVGKTIGEFGIY